MAVTHPVDPAAIRETLHAQSRRIDHVQEAALGASKELADLRAYAESLEQLIAAQAARLAELEQWRAHFNFRLKVLEPCDGL